MASCIKIKKVGLELFTDTDTILLIEKINRVRICHAIY